MSKLDSLIHLISDESIHKEYSVKDYVSLCTEIRQLILAPKNTNIEDTAKTFFEKQFVEEMEPLSVICHHFFSESNGSMKVQYTGGGAQPDNEPDGKIIFVHDFRKEICLEFTTAADRRWLNFAIEQTRNGKITSLTGHTSADITGNRLKGYQDIVNPVEAESEEQAVENQRRRIAAAIERKLQNRWINRPNWLCVVIDDITHWNNRIQEAMNPIFSDMQATYRDQLNSKYIEALCFLGYGGIECGKGWLSLHQDEPS